MKKIAVSIVTTLIVSLFLLSTVSALPNLPPGQVYLTLTWPGSWPASVALSGIPVGSYDVTNSPPAYTAWCAQFYNRIDPGTTYPTTLVSSLNLPTPMDKINYLLNVNTGADMDLQVAIWLILGTNPADITALYGSSQPSADANAMYNDANTNGGGFVPSEGQLMAVKCEEGGDVQDLFIQITVPRTQAGLSPGYWKHNVDVYCDGPGSYSAPQTGSPHESDTSMTKYANWILANINTGSGVTTADAFLHWANQQFEDKKAPDHAATWLMIANWFNAAAGYTPYSG